MSNDKKYKDSIFRELFSNPNDIRQLYNALGNTDYGDDVPIEIKTIQDTAYADIKNDLAFTIDNKFVVMVEHQSSINKNMPFRMLKYFERIMRGIFPQGYMYRESIVKFPTPEFYVLYNGPKEISNDTVWKLSDAFMAEAKENSIELVVKVVNVRYNKDAELLDRCRVLKEYSIFIDRIDNYILEGCDKHSAIEKAVDECLAEDILKDFLTEHRAEVLDEMYGDISYEEFVEIRAQEQYEIGMNEGINKGISIGRNEGISIGRNEGISIGEKRGIEKVLRTLGISEEEYEKLKKQS